MMIIGQILTVAAAAIALQAVLPSIWTGFQIVGSSTTNSSPSTPTGAQNAVILGVILLVVTTVINIVGIRLMSIVNSTGVALELLGVIPLVIALFATPSGALPSCAHVRRRPDTGLPLHLGVPRLRADGGLRHGRLRHRGELSEETRTPRRIAPRTIIRALVVSGIGGALLLMAALMAAPSLTDGNLATIGLPYVVEAVLGSIAGRIMLVDVTIAICVCTLACQTSASRMMFSMARHQALPSTGAGQGQPAHRHADRPPIVVGAGAASPGRQPPQSAVFPALSSVASRCCTSATWA